MTVTLHLPPGLKENEPAISRQKTGQVKQSRPERDMMTRTGFITAGMLQTPIYPSSLCFRRGVSGPAGSALRVCSPKCPPGSTQRCTLPGPILPGVRRLSSFYRSMASINGDRKRRLQYLPPKVSVEGNGIKRGLTAVEAAILMQQPMDKILTMILFSVVKKGAATVVSREPMKLKGMAPPAGGPACHMRTSFVQAMAV